MVMKLTYNPIYKISALLSACRAQKTRVLTPCSVGSDFSLTTARSSNHHQTCAIYILFGFLYLFAFDASKNDTTMLCSCLLTEYRGAFGYQQQHKVMRLNDVLPIESACKKINREHEWRIRFRFVCVLSASFNRRVSETKHMLCEQIHCIC